MRISYHFMANLHIPETRSAVFLSKYDKVISQYEQKSTLKTDLLVNDWISRKPLQRLKRISGCNRCVSFFKFQFEVNSFQSEKTSQFQFSAVPQATVSLSRLFVEVTVKQ